MGNPFFRFKQFTVHHDKCAMKVGMDGSLLGAWAGGDLSPERILDVGTGTGLIALMCAQRFPKAEITAIDFPGGCLEQAQDNIDRSPFASRISLQGTILQQFESNSPFDLIVCNPPFFNKSSKSGSSERDKARHDDGLPFNELVRHTSDLLTPKGVLSVIIPEDRAPEFMGRAEEVHLHLNRSVKVRGRIGGVVKRRLLEFSPQLPLQSPELEELAVEADIKQWTREYEELLREFYVVL